MTSARPTTCGTKLSSHPDSIVLFRPFIYTMDKITLTLQDYKS
jgi:hypothetical protein